MKNFTIRVFLHGESYSPYDYAELDSILEKNEIYNTITSDQGRTYQLPPGEYTYKGDLDRKILLDKVKAATGELAKKYSVLITESRGRTWFNLETNPDPQ